MHAIPHRSNSDFQIRHFIAGSCHTPDGAYVLLMAQMETAAAALVEAQAKGLELRADLDDAELEAASADAHPLRSQARLLRIKQAMLAHQRRSEGATAEAATIWAALDELRPQCRYADKPLAEQAELAQRDEWREELKHRAENMMAQAATGISSDQISAMRMHPDFQSDILPHIVASGKRLRSSTDWETAVTSLLPPSTLAIG